MLAFFRRALSSWAVLGLLGLVMLAFIITGVGTPSGLGGFGIGGADKLASVGRESVTAPQVTTQVNRYLSRVQQEQPEATMAMLIRDGLFDQLLDSLITAMAMTAFATDHGLAASDRLIDGEIASAPAFQNVAGKFDPDLFRRALEAQRLDEQELRDGLRDQMLQRQLLVPATDAPRVPEALARAYAELLLEQRSAMIGLVPAAVVGPGAEPTEAEVAAFFKQRIDRYTIPERRVLRYAAFDLEQVAATAQATEAEIEAAYKARAAEFGPTETRTLSQVVLPDERTAREFASRLSGGQSFADAARQAGFQAPDTALGSLTRERFERVSSPSVAAAAFALPKGGVTPPTRSPLGWHIVRVENIETTPGRPLASVRDELAREINQRKQEEALTALVTRIEDAIGQGASFDEVVRDNQLTARDTPPITATGSAPDQPDFRLAPDLAPILKPGFDMSPDEDPVIETLTSNQRYALLAVSRVIPAAPPPLAEVRERVHADLIGERSLARARTMAQQIADKANGGAAIRDAFRQASANLPGLESLTISRIDFAQRQQAAPVPIQLMFRMAKGKTRIVADPAGRGYFVVNVTEVVPGDISKQPQLVEMTRRQLAPSFRTEYGEQFAQAIRREMNVKRNEEAIARLRSQLQNNTAPQ